MAFGFGIVGCGMISKFHVRAINDLDKANFVGCTSRSFSSAEKLAEQFGAKAYESLEQMLADPEIDIVSICTPSGAHMEPAIAAANAGKHVVIEKPLEITLERCDAVIEACERNHVTLSTIFPSRFHRASLLMKQAVDENRFGTITLGDAYVKWYRTQEYYDSGAWRGTWELDGGGALMNQAIHSIDLLLWLMGPVKSLTAATATLAHDRIEVEDVATVSLKFKNGALGVIEASTAAYPGALKRIEIQGSKGTAILEEESIKAWDFAEMTDADVFIKNEMADATETGGGASDPSAIGHAAHTEQFLDITHAIENGKAPSIDGREGRKSVELILAIYEAAKTERAVQL